MDIEIFIRDIDVEQSVRWLESRLGELIEVEVSDGIHYLRTAPDRARVVVTPNMEEGPFLSLYLSGELPWTASRELAVPCALELGRTVRWCDEASDEWLEKSGHGPTGAINW